LQDAKDVFQETLIRFDQNLREGRFEGRSSLSTYFVAIAKWHWVSLARKANKTTVLEPSDLEGADAGVEQGYLAEEQKKLLESAMAQTGERCKQLLKLYQLDYNMEEIAQHLGYNNADVAKKEAYRCRARLREVLTQPN
jgi:RNA polymerase sigma factor (sigma-70 family)